MGRLSQSVITPPCEREALPRRQGSGRGAGRRVARLRAAPGRARDRRVQERSRQRRQRHAKARCQLGAPSGRLRKERDHGVNAKGDALASFPPDHPLCRHQSWSRRPGMIRGPLVYETSALPLSYVGERLCLQRSAPRSQATGGTVRAYPSRASAAINRRRNAAGKCAEPRAGSSSHDGTLSYVGERRSFVEDGLPWRDRGASANFS